jgi:urea transporter
MSQLIHNTINYFISVFSIAVRYLNFPIKQYMATILRTYHAQIYTDEFAVTAWRWLEETEYAKNKHNNKQFVLSAEGNVPP